MPNSGIAYKGQESPKIKILEHTIFLLASIDPREPAICLIIRAKKWAAPTVWLILYAGLTLWNYAGRVISAAGSSLDAAWVNYPKC